MKKKENYPSFSSPKDAVSRSITHVAASVLVNLSSSSDDRDSDLDTDSDSNSEGDNGVSSNKNKFEEPKAVLPVAQLPLPSSPPPPSPKDSRRALALVPRPEDASLSVGDNNCRQFWKAGEFEGFDRGVWDSSSGGMDHVRVHPKFLHSNATSHKWALGAFAELLDNSLDEVCNGATYVSIDMIPSMKDGSKMILIEDDGGGMDPDRMRQCMSLGYSAKSKIANTIGQYGNGFKTSTMRLGADVIVFSRRRGKDGKRPTQSIGLLSYTFLRSTGKEDIVVPMLDYEWDEQEWEKMTRFSAADWNRNMETITDWSPFSSETDLLLQFSSMSDHGTRIIIYNLWEEDEGQLELDFETDPHDIQLRGVNRDEKNIQMAKQYPNSWHFLTYKHSLRSYASILYLRLPPSFQIILRGKAVQHHNIVNDLMLCKEITYRPQFRADVAPRDLNMTAEVTVGFVKDAKHHIDVQGFNVYHKNRLIKPFWRIWNPAGVDGRGVIGVLEANFIEPAHDKQGFERTVTLARLETRLIAMQRTYWTNNCHFVGYKPRGGRKNRESADSLKRESERFVGSVDCGSGNGDMRRTESEQDVMSKRQSLGALTLPSLERIDACGSEDASPESGSRSVDRLKQKNLLQRLQKRGGEVKATVMHILECEKCDSLKKQVEETEQRIEELTKERESLVDVFADERERRNMEEEQLRKRVKNASNTVQELLDKVKLLEMKKASNCKA